MYSLHVCFKDDALAFIIAFSGLDGEGEADPRKITNDRLKEIGEMAYLVWKEN